MSTEGAVLAQALEHLVRGIVDHPDEVSVDLISQGRNRVLEVQVHPDDVGKVIGRNGRTVRALRQIMGSVGGRGIRVEIIDDVDGPVDEPLDDPAVEPPRGVAATAEPA